jgi:hypothetical protein
MTSDFNFASFVPVTQRASLEALLYFNAGQERVEAGIVDAIEKYGSPEIIQSQDRLRISIAALPEAQTIFAIEHGTRRPVGVAVYIRPQFDCISVLHLGVAEEFATGGRRANEHLLFRLLREVRRTSRQIKGVQRCEVFYLQGRTKPPRVLADRQPMYG